ncbi:DM13 domain-containing protein [Ferrimonas balearica]|uniref:DM13 domain-containing protein n=1 Tax=Ferrimonas balearica TaxID=44012 RepID=UPI001C9A2752|nr:DM13 domain-containing protein [Ferrimonas balearica]MBY5921551.1 DM13 domain-containing protein [Ferrimonas balearica]MBY5995109.1 DM13 domain-containing protein [Ferrimonas balearica]
MNVGKTLTLFASHTLVAAIGFAVGVYTLPILTAPDSPELAQVQSTAQQALYRGQFVRELADSDALHWGEGEVTLGPDAIAFEGRLAPGPDYQLYLSPEFVETEADFNRLKSRMVRVGPVKTFENFIVPLTADLDPSQYRAVIVWCESFGQFITAAQYR